jgi:hypothetical protein
MNNAVFAVVDDDVRRRQQTMEARQRAAAVAITTTSFVRSMRSKHRTTNNNNNNNNNNIETNAIPAHGAFVDVVAARQQQHAPAQSHLIDRVSRDRTASNVVSNSCNIARRSAVVGESEACSIDHRVARAADDAQRRHRSPVIVVVNSSVAQTRTLLFTNSAKKKPQRK